MSENLKFGIFLAVVFGFVAYVGNDFLLKFESPSNSESLGTPHDGGLTNGKRLPTSGANFQTYSRFGSFIGRTYVHGEVRNAVVDAYDGVLATAPDVVFVFGETGWPWGGEFWPHRTHQNGMSVDFFVPVRRSGESVALPTGPLEKWGYGLDFNDVGRCDNYEIDFEAMGVHLLELDRTAKKHGLKIVRVIFDPELQKELKKAKAGKKAMRKLDFNDKPVWIRHDEHYHVDFDLITKGPQPTPKSMKQKTKSKSSGDE
jgi:penicillin-insensitive murein endopeptidase